MRARTDLNPQKGMGGPARSWNRYSYVLNNPLQLVDPSGLNDKPAQCGQKSDGQEKKVAVPADIRATPSWTVDDDMDGQADGEIVLPSAAAEQLINVSVVNYQAEFIQTTDQLNLVQHGPVSQTVLQQDSGSVDAIGASSERSAGASLNLGAQPSAGATVGGKEARSTNFSSAGGTSISQTLDTAPRCNAIALDRAAAITNNNAINALTGMTVTVYRGETATPMTLNRAQATKMVQATTNEARKYGALDAYVAFPLRSVK